ncbi:MAG: ABC transporter permease [Muribaculaceae bacterium]|nr:ABC transporter permease [Muribaculaceae bacterium]
MFDLFREIAQSMRNNKLRTALTGVAVAWGIFMLILLLGAARGLINAQNDRFSRMAFNTITFYNGRTGMPYKGYPENRLINFKESDIHPVKKEISNVSDVEVNGWVDTVVITTIKGAISRGFNAVYPKAVADQRLKIVAGRFINDRDIAECRRSMVIYRGYADEHFGSPEQAIGRTVKCWDLAWTIVGVYDDPWRKETYAPYTTYKALTGFNDEAYRLTVYVDGLKTEEDATLAEDSIRAKLAELHEFHPQDRRAVWGWNQFKSYLSQTKAMTMLNLGVWVIGIFTLLSGIVGVSNIMFVSVRERTHEIGIRRAIGAKPRSILVQILAESVAVTALFGYIGVCLGMVSLQILDYFVGDSSDFLNPTVDISIAIQVTVALIIAGAIAGLFPALKAIKVKPVEALRDE